MKKYLLFIFIIIKTAISMNQPQADEVMINLWLYNPGMTYEEFKPELDKSLARLSKEIDSITNSTADAVRYKLMHTFYARIIASKYDYKIIHYYACKQEIKTQADITTEMLNHMVRVSIPECAVNQIKNEIFQYIQNTQRRRRAFIKLLIENQELNAAYQEILSGTTTQIPEKIILEFETYNSRETVHKVRPFLHLIIKNLGELFGFFDFKAFGA